MEYQSSFSIEKLIESIGPVESKALLTEALPIIIARKHTILKALEQKDLVESSKQAHRTAGSIRLYGSSRLEALLKEVISLKSNQNVRSDLYKELESGFDASIHEIQERLSHIEKL